MPASIKHLTDKKLNLDNKLLARWKDGLYYAAIMVKCDPALKKCLVCFEDQSEVWVNNRDVHIQLTLDQIGDADDIVCCICDDGNSEQPNEIILCDLCSQGYHQMCHTPPVDSSKIDSGDAPTDHKDWYCATCSYILNQSDRQKYSSTPATTSSQQAPKRQQQQQQQPQTPPPTTKGRPRPSVPVGPQRRLASPQTTPTKPSKQVPVVGQSTRQVAAPASAAKTTPSQVRVMASPVARPVTTTTTNTTTTTSVAPPRSPQTSSPSVTSTTSNVNSPTTTSTNNNSTTPSKPVKVKQTPTREQQAAQLRASGNSIGPAKSSNSLSHQRQTPYYPLSNQVRAAATSSATAALASLTASSALVVGGSVGRSKQEIVQQSNKSSQQRQQRVAQSGSVTSSPAGSTSSEASSNAVVSSTISTTINNNNNIQSSPPIRPHAVRKSGINFVMPQRQSALPTATRSILPSATGSPGAIVSSTPPQQQQQPNNSNKSQPPVSKSPVIGRVANNSGAVTSSSGGGTNHGVTGGVIPSVNNNSSIMQKSNNSAPAGANRLAGTVSSSPVVVAPSVFVGGPPPPSSAQLIPKLSVGLPIGAAAGSQVPLVNKLASLTSGLDPKVSLTPATLINNPAALQAAAAIVVAATAASHQNNNNNNNIGATSNNSGGLPQVSVITQHTSNDGGAK